MKTRMRKITSNHEHIHKDVPFYHVILGSVFVFKVAVSVGCTWEEYSADHAGHDNQEHGEQLKVPSYN